MAGAYPGGGSVALDGYFEEYGSELYSDLLRYYGVDVVGLVSEPPALSPAQALALIEGLPLGSSFAAKAGGVPDSAGWDTNSFMLASLIDAVRENTYANMQVRTKKKLKRPDPVKVPGARPKKAGNSFVKMAQKVFRENALKEESSG